MSVTAILSDLPADVHSSEVPAILSFHYFFDRIAEFDEIDLKWDKSLKRQCCLRATRSDTAEQNGSKTSNNFPVATVTMFSSIIRI
ncbi:MAG: hypothetical protein JW863_18300 [Chitinispirillaceae bacterium]|nr:hypothetical protein [Chitinispirillaceae bacterium]